LSASWTGFGQLQSACSEDLACCRFAAGQRNRQAWRRTADERKNLRDFFARSGHLPGRAESDDSGPELDRV